MKILTLCAALAATPALADFPDDYCATNSLVVYSIGSMYVTHNLSDDMLYRLIDEFYAPGDWSPGAIWENVRAMKRAMDGGVTPMALADAMNETCLEDW